MDKLANESSNADCHGTNTQQLRPKSTTAAYIFSSYHLEGRDVSIVIFYLSVLTI